MIAERMFLGSRRPYVLQVFRVGRSVGGEVAARVEQAQIPVRPAAYSAGVMVVLTVVLPEADIANLVTASLAQRQVTAARAGIRAAFRPSLHVDERPRVITHHGAQLSIPATAAVSHQ